MILLLAMLLTHSNPVLQQAELLFQTDQWDEAKKYYRMAMKEPLDPTEKAFVHLHYHWIESREWMRPMGLPHTIPWEVFKSLSPESKSQLEREIYSYIRWKTIIGFDSETLMVISWFLQGNISSLIRLRTQFLLGLWHYSHNRIAAAQWFFAGVIFQSKNFADQRIHALGDLARIHMARIQRDYGDLFESQEWLREIEPQSRWAVQACVESMWNAFAMQQYDGVLATAKALKIAILEQSLSEDLPPGTRKMALQAFLLEGFVQLKMGDFNRARSTYLLALESIRSVREQIQAIQNKRIFREVAEEKGMNPFEAKSSRVDFLRSWMDPPKVNDINSIFDSHLRTMKTLGDYPSLVKNQRRLTDDTLSFNLQLIKKKLGLISLEAISGFEDVLWHSKVEQKIMKDELQRVKEQGVERMRERTHALQ